MSTDSGTAAPSAVMTGDGVDKGVPWHYGDPFREQRVLVDGAGVLDRSNRDVLTVTGADRLSWLHTICSQHVADLAGGDCTESLVLSPNGHVEQHWQLAVLGETVWLDTEPAAGATVLEYLAKMRFMKRVEPLEVSADWGVVSLVGPTAAQVLQAAGFDVPALHHAVPIADRVVPGGGFVRGTSHPGVGGFDLVVPRPTVVDVIAALRASGAEPVGTWAYEAARVQSRQPRLGFETDHRTIPHEVGWIGSAVHLNKGCYRGQETVARVQNLGKPPRRLVLLHLAGDSEQLPAPGMPVELNGRVVGFVGTAVHHFELGPIALAVIKRTLPDDAALTVAGSAVTVS